MNRVISIHSKLPANKAKGIGLLKITFQKQLIRLIESIAEKHAMIRWPQYLVEPQHVEG